MIRKRHLLIAELVLILGVMSCGISVDLGLATKTPTNSPPTATRKATHTQQPSNTPTQNQPTLTPMATASPTPLPPEEIMLSNLDRLQPVRSFASAGLLHSLSVSPDGQHLLIGTTNTLAILTLVDLQSVWFNQPDFTPLSVVFSSDGTQLVVETKGGAVIRLDAATGSELSKPIAQQKNVQFQALSPSGAYFAVTDYSDTTTVWETTTGAVIFKNNGQAYPGGISGIQFSTDDTSLLIMGYDSKSIFQVQQWAIPTGAFRIGLTAIGQQMVNWKHSKDGKRVFGIDTKPLTSKESTVLMAWDSGSGKNLPTISREDLINDYQPSFDGSYVLIATRENGIKQIDSKSGSVLATFSGHASPIKKMALTPDEKQVVSIDMDGNIKLWDLFNQEVIAETSIPPVARLGWAGFSSDALRVVSPGIGTGSILVVDPNLASITTNIPQMGTEVINVVAISHQGHLVAGCDRNNQIYIWDALSGEQVGQIESKARFRTTMLKFSPDDQWLASLSDGEIFVWDVESSEKIQGVAGFEEMEFSSDGKNILTGNAEFGFSLYEIASGKRVTAATTNFKVTKLFNLPGDKYLFSGGYRLGSPGDNLISAIKLFEADSLKPVEGEITTEPAIVLDVAISPNSEIMVTSDSYGNINFWDFAEGLTLSQFEALAYPPAKLAFNRDGTILFVAGADGTITSFITSPTEEPIATEDQAAAGLILSDQPFTHSSGAYSVRLPDGWKVEEGGSMGLSVSAQDASGFILIQAVNTYSELTGSLFEKLVNNYNEMIKRSFGQIEVIDNGYDDENGTAFTTRKVNISGMDYIHETYFTRDGTTLQIVDFLSLIDLSEAYLPTYIEVFSSLTYDNSIIQSKPAFDLTETVKGPNDLYSFEAPLLWEMIQTDDSGTTVYAYKSIEEPSRALFSSIFLKGDGNNEFTDEVLETTAAALLESMEFEPALSSKQVLSNGDLRYEFVSVSKQMEGIVICSKFGTQAHFWIVGYRIDSRDEYKPLLEYLETGYKRMQ